MPCYSSHAICTKFQTNKGIVFPHHTIIATLLPKLKRRPKILKRPKTQVLFSFRYKKYRFYFRFLPVVYYHNVI